MIIGGCWPGECHYITEGNYDALANMHLGKKLLERIGVNPERLKLEWIAASEGTRFAGVMNDFAKQVRDLGPLGIAEGIDAMALQRKLEAANQRVPFIKLIEAEKLRPAIKSEKVYEEFYNSDALNQEFDELIADRLAINQILLLLENGPRSFDEVAKKLVMNATAVSQHLDSASRQGLVTYDSVRESHAVVEGARDTNKLLSYYIDPDECMACLICLKKCPFKSIDGAKRKIHVIDQNDCVACGICFEVCPPRFGAVKRILGQPVPPSLPEEERTVRRT